MYYAVFSKFTQYTELQVLLLGTGEAIPLEHTKK